MQTVYIQRWTEDLPSVLEEEFNMKLHEENDVYIDGRTATHESGGLLDLVKILDC